MVDPKITINNPQANEVFGATPPSFNISINEPNLNTTWYSLNGGVNTTFTGLIGSINQTLWNALAEGNVSIRFYASDSAGNIGFTDFTILKQLPQEPGILDCLTNPVCIITMCILVGGAIGVIVVIKKKSNKSTDKEIMRIEKILQDEE